MRLPLAPDKYDRTDQTRARAAIEAEDKQNRKRGVDVEIAGAERLILSSPNGTRYKITVSNTGVLAAVAL